ncbi:DUF7146 domain-containing protein [Paraburkholderia sp. JPY419]|uniref:DUF7146 domain-containing protein n=1 Tax=Paraburkholderia sp. JPY419 TaxID=667660 RepID=UPI003D22D6CA
MSLANFVVWADFPTGKHRIACPVCARGRGDRTLGVTIEHDGNGVAHCFRCDFTESFRPERGANCAITPRIKAAAPTAKQDLSDYGRDLWCDCRALSGVALAYLDARRCRMPPVDGDLRSHPSLKHPTGYVGPALVALVTDALTREPISLHRTWICADGRKAEVDPPRLLLGGHRKQGGVIRLWPDEAVTVGLGIAEGIETALSFAWAHTPVWSLIDAGNLAAFPLLPAIESLGISVDDDAAGLAAARKCVQRWANAGREVTLAKVTHGT